MNISWPHTGHLEVGTIAKKEKVNIFLQVQLYVLFYKPTLFKAGVFLSSKDRISYPL